MKKTASALVAALVLAGPAAAATLDYEFRLEGERFFDVIDPSAADLGASDGLGPVVTDGRARGLAGPFADLALGDVIGAEVEVEAGEVVGCRFGTRTCGTVIFSSISGEDRWEIQTLFDVISFRDGRLTFVEDEAGEADNGLMWMAAEATFSEVVGAPTVVPVAPAGALFLGALPMLWALRRRR